ncbi:hypothetical protein [Serratia plymuthica]|uniref:hypothetical protein n=1 Tax=Serratia plymuthica TaxID=82996 RepID=UPI0007ABF3E6|nr:hypothetical protein [Serratia plymuthica]QPS63500.1 hypothetical protein I6G52_01400 [Serratia plymuthica]
MIVAAVIGHNVAYGGVAIVEPLIDRDKGIMYLKARSWDNKVDGRADNKIGLWSETFTFYGGCNLGTVVYQNNAGVFSKKTFREHMYKGGMIVSVREELPDEEKCRQAKVRWDNNDNDGWLSVDMNIVWSGHPPPVTCDVVSGDIVLPPASNTDIVRGTAPVRITCDGSTDFIASIAAESDGRLQYTAGGAVDMTFDGGDPAQPYTIHGRAEKGAVIETTLRATTVAGWAEPGTYIGHAVLRVELP